MKLFVDDIRQEPPGWERARTITEAIRALASGMVEVISLDHDIAIAFNDPDLKRYVEGSSDETFQPIAYYLYASARAFGPPTPRVLFHTGNIGAGQTMARIIGCDFKWWHYGVDNVEEILEGSQ